MIIVIFSDPKDFTVYIKLIILLIQKQNYFIINKNEMIKV